MIFLNSLIINCEKNLRFQKKFSPVLVISTLFKTFHKSGFAQQLIMSIGLSSIHQSVAVLILMKSPWLKLEFIKGDMDESFALKTLSTKPIVFILLCLYK